MKSLWTKFRNLQLVWKIVSVLALLGVLVMGATLIYVKLINDPPAKLTTSDLDAALSNTTPPTSKSAGTLVTSQPTASAPPNSSASSAGADGTWNVTAASDLRYRVKEVLNGLDTEAVGKTNAITGSLTIAGTTASVADFTVDMNTFTSDESQRDSSFRDRVMQVSQFPTGSFKLTKPIDFAKVPADGEKLTTTATGDLMLHGVTKSVTFELTATLSNGKIGILGNIPVLFSDYKIDNPSFAFVTTKDNGLLEFILVFEPA